MESIFCTFAQRTYPSDDRSVDSLGALRLQITKDRDDPLDMESIASGVWTWRRCLCMNGLFLSLQDVNARTMEARRDGGLAYVS